MLPPIEMQERALRKLAELEQYALANMRYGASYEQEVAGQEEVALVRDVLGLPEWDKKTVTEI